MSEQYSNHRDTPLRRFNTFWWGLSYFGIFGLVSAVVYSTTDVPADVEDMRKADRLEIRNKVDNAQEKELDGQDIDSMADKVVTPAKVSEVVNPNVSVEPAWASDPTYIAKGKELFPIKGCVTCHGADGASPTASIYPKLNDKKAAYFYKQMQDIKSGARVTSLTPVMKPFIDQCEEEDIKAMAAWLGSQK